MLFACCVRAVCLLSWARVRWPAECSKKRLPGQVQTSRLRLLWFAASVGLRRYASPAAAGQVCPPVLANCFRIEA